MGAFFTSVHVRVRTVEGNACNHVFEDVLELLTKQGLSPTKDGETPDRTVLIEDAQDWISVYDEACEASGLRISVETEEAPDPDRNGARSAAPVLRRLVHGNHCLCGRA